MLNIIRVINPWSKKWERFKSIFPKEFERVLAECYTKNDAFQRVLENDQFQKAVMDIMAKELYKTLVSEK